MFWMNMAFLSCMMDDWCETFFNSNDLLNKGLEHLNILENIKAIFFFFYSRSLVPSGLSMRNAFSTFERQVVSPTDKQSLFKKQGVIHKEVQRWTIKGVSHVTCPSGVSETITGTSCPVVKPGGSGCSLVAVRR